MFVISGRDQYGGDLSHFLVTQEMELENRCIEIVEELVSKHKQWVTFELVVSILLDRYSVTKLEDLGVVQIESIRTLHLVLELNKRLNVFLGVYSGSRGVLTLFDLDIDACAMLKTFQYPTMTEIKAKREASDKDPNEIGIGLEQSSASLPSLQTSRMADFGLGQLQTHPFVATMFPTASLLRWDQMKRLSDVLVGISHYLQRYDQDLEPDNLVSNTGSIDVGRLANYLLTERWRKEGYESLAMAGVHLQHVGAQEILACKHQSMAAEESKISQGDSNIVDTAVGIMRSKRLNEDQEDTSSKKARKEDGQQSGSLELRMNRHADKNLSSLFVEEIPTSELKELCFAKEWAEDSKLKDHDRDRVAGATDGTSGGAAATATVAKETGRWGEALVYHFLMSRLKPSRKVLWVNREEESQAAYDLIVEEPVVGQEMPRTKTTFIEVKSTRFPDRNVFDISLNEWAFASAEPALQYDIYRVYNAGDPNTVRITIVKDLYRQIKDQKVRLALVI